MTELWSQDPRHALRVTPDFDLAAFDRNSAPGWAGSKADAERYIKDHEKLLDELQERLFAHGRSGGTKKVLVIVQGLDTAGKGGIARHVFGLFDPQGIRLTSFGAPTEEERAHHYLWRIEKALPRPGLIGLFDRSHYEDVLVVRVDELVEEDVWRKRYDEINEWERGLVDDDFVVLKFAMMVSKDEQAKRLMERLDRPDKRWKYNPGDLDTRDKWDEFQAAYSDVFRLTSTDHAPWMVLPADKKWYARLAVTEVLLRTLIDLDLSWPEPEEEWTPEAERERLARSMSPEALAEDYADTEETVLDAIDNSLEVSEEAALIRTQGEPKDVQDAAVDSLEAKRAVLLADLQATMTHKRRLLDQRGS
ncbi:polyphosphate kinase 2 family protein [Tessaracoccus lubricantis]|uniref:Polyphosphate kinase 2 family protein n=1 Tax=Tessaracoccus lubricantis TaxID=545543 RepID=A0ABP9F7E5_9ACTN